MEKRKVLITAPYIMPIVDKIAKILNQYGFESIVCDVNERAEEEDLMKWAGNFDAAICGDDRFSEKVISSCIPRLKVISKWGTGIDSIDAAAAKKLGVKVCNTPNAFTTPVSDTVIGYVLSFARNIHGASELMKKGFWQKLPSRSLSECVLGVIGVGNIGKEVIRKATSMGMKCLGNDIVNIEKSFLSNYNVTQVEKSTALRESDFISLNCTLNESSFHIIDSQSFKSMKKNAIVINTARGALIDQHALVCALQNNKIAGAALDVFEDEPLSKDSLLLGMENVLLAPHNSNSSPVAWKNVHYSTLRNLIYAFDKKVDFLAKEEFVYLID